MDIYFFSYVPKLVQIIFVMLMPIFLSVFLVCLLLGSLVGFLAGLLGIGGGLIIVPVLVYILPYFDISTDVALPIAIATSLASIVFTSSSAAYAHHKNSNIPWHIAKQLSFTVAGGAMVGAYLAAILPIDILTFIFSTAVFALALYMFLSIKIERGKSLPSGMWLQFLGFFTGIIASLMGIAGGAILVPILVYYSLSIRQAIGVATACGIVVALFGSISFIILAPDNIHIPPWSLGYIYLPALLGIVTTSSMSAQAGVKVAKKLPVVHVKKLFAIFLLLVAIKMMW